MVFSGKILRKTKFYVDFNLIFSNNLVGDCKNLRQTLLRMSFSLRAITTVNQSKQKERKNRKGKFAPGFS